MSFNSTKPLLGNVYLGWDIKTGQDVALKFETIQSRHDWLCHEHSVYKVLSNVAGVLSMYWYGREAMYNVLILDHLNLTLEELISKHYDISLVFLYATQMVFLSLHSTILDIWLISLFYSYLVLSQYIVGTTSIGMLN